MVVTLLPSALRVDVDGSDDDGEVRLESRTTFGGLDRNGVAYLDEGEEVIVRTLRCRNERGRTRLVVERVEALEES